MFRQCIYKQYLFVSYLRSVGALCRRQGLYEQADYIEACATKSTQDPKAIDRALAIIRQLCIYDDTNLLIVSTCRSICGSIGPTSVATYQLRTQYKS